MKILIFGINIKKALNNEYVGGAEKQLALLAKLFVSLKHDFFVLEPFPGKKEPEKIAGIKIIQAWDSLKGIPSIRAFFYRIPSLYKNIKQENPDIIYARGAGIYNALIAFWFRKDKVRFIWGLASDYDLQPKMKKNNKPTLYSLVTNQLMFKLSTKMLVRYAKAIICQTKEQENFLKLVKKVGKIYRIPNICEVLDAKNYLVDNKKNCLWVGKFSGTKGEKDFLLLAKKIPSINIIAVGHATADFKKTSIYNDIINQPNIKCVGRLKYNELIDLYKKALLLVHTAPSEGFSNVFLEAWSFGVPVVSLNVDPDRLLQKGALGCFSDGSIEKMKKQIEELVINSSLRKKISCETVNYVGRNHSVAVIGGKFNNLFYELC